MRAAAPFLRAYPNTMERTQPMKLNLDDVNVLIGTGGGGTEYGGTMPLVTAPFGMTNWTAQTRQNAIGRASYAIEDGSISGFIGTHQPAVWMGDYGYVTLIPQAGPLRVSAQERSLPFVREDEAASPDYYRVLLDPQGAKISVEVTATERCALFRFAGASRLVIEASRPGIEGEARMGSSSREIVGRNPHRMDSMYGPCRLPGFGGYFVVQFDREPESVLTTHEDGVFAVAEFDGRPFQARVGTSFISVEQARENLRLEVGSKGFDEVREDLRATWNEKLSLVSVEGASPDERAILATGLYHALLYPRIFSEHGRYYGAFDDSVHEGESYTAFSLWDTFRAEHALIALLAPERVDGMIRALLQNYQQGGWLPKWPNPSYTNIMVATHADSVIAEAVAKGFSGFDLELAYEAMVKNGTVPPDEDTEHRWHDREEFTPYKSRPGLTWARTLGYHPNDRVAESLSLTLECAYDDWCIAQVALALGRLEEAEEWLARSQNYRNVWDKETGFMRARNLDGSWGQENDGLTEGDKWTYNWCVLHDVPGLIELMGGPERFVQRLDEHFEGGHNRHDNEPCHHYAYLYALAGFPWKTQRRVRELAETQYANRPDGLTGNEDCGQMSAWHIFAALGFYPVCPASAEYIIGSPLHPRIDLALPGGTFSVIAEGNSKQNVFIQSATLNGQPLTEPRIQHSQVVGGGELRFIMGPQPSEWGALRP